VLQNACWHATAAIEVGAMWEDNYSTVGRLFYVLSLAAFGVQCVHSGHFARGLPPVPAWVPGGPFGAYLVGVALLAAAVGIGVPWNGRLSATLVGLLLLACGVLHLQHVHDVLYDGSARTAAFEVLAFAGSAFVLADELPVQWPRAQWIEGAIEKSATLGRLLFALALGVFGLQHFWYAAFVASLIPDWMPGPLFLTYLTGAGFIAAGLSLAFGVGVRLAASLLAAMFFLWVVLLHAPRVAAQPSNGDEWSSAFVALAMCGASLIIACARPKTDGTGGRRGPPVTARHAARAVERARASSAESS
jgi:uncharacterized membrane protein YphA (DoxX/SURF4 family)